MVTADRLRLRCLSRQRKAVTDLRMTKSSSDVRFTPKSGHCAFGTKPCQSRSERRFGLRRRLPLRLREIVQVILVAADSDIPTGELHDVLGNIQTLLFVARRIVASLSAFFKCSRSTRVSSACMSFVLSNSLRMRAACIKRWTSIMCRSSRLSLMRRATRLR